MCSSANVSHLTCNKAEQISCSLPLNVRLLPQGARRSLNTPASPRLRPRTQHFYLPTAAKGATFMPTDCRGVTLQVDHDEVRHISNTQISLSGFGTSTQVDSDGAKERASVVHDGHLPQ